ncbi:MAG: hypothetical protein JSR26_06060 [Proteobacteria bacterium]|nr:hypothetical protein [Pseudomonadota bacterium]
MPLLMRPLPQICLQAASTLMLAASCGCSQNYLVYSISGVQAKFCVPKSHTLPEVLLKLPGASVEDKGFAFAGCRYAPAGTQCNVLKSIITGSTAPYKTFKGWRWQDFPNDTPIRALASSPNSTLKSKHHGSVVVVSNKQDWRWYVWLKANHLSANEKPFLEEGDQLIATCRTQTVVIADKNVKEIACNRIVRGQDYVLNYSFVSDTPIPQGVETLDSTVFSQIDSWRCKQ